MHFWSYFQQLTWTKSFLQQTSSRWMIRFKPNNNCALVYCPLWILTKIADWQSQLQCQFWERACKCQRATQYMATASRKLESKMSERGDRCSIFRWGTRPGQNLGTQCSASAGPCNRISSPCGRCNKYNKSKYMERCVFRWVGCQEVRND